jgi:hypothetical protein
VRSVSTERTCDPSTRAMLVASVRRDRRRVTRHGPRRLSPCGAPPPTTTQAICDRGIETTSPGAPAGDQRSPKIRRSGLRERVPKAEPKRPGAAGCRTTGSLAPQAATAPARGDEDPQPVSLRREGQPSRSRRSLNPANSDLLSWTTSMSTGHDCCRATKPAFRGCWIEAPLAIESDESRQLGRRPSVY